MTDQAHSQPASNLSGVGAVVLAYGAGSSAGSVAEGLKGAGLQPQRLVVVVNPDGSGIGPRLPGWAARLDCGSNLGYAAAMNAGIAKLKGTAAEWILVATHDISVSSACLTASSSRSSRIRLWAPLGPVCLTRSQARPIPAAG